MVAIDDRTWQVDGRMQLSDLMERLGLKGEYEAETVGGWVSEVLGYIPTVNTRFAAEGLKGVVTAMDRRRVTRIRLTREPEPAAKEKTEETA